MTYIEYCILIKIAVGRRKGKARVTVWHKATIQHNLDRGAVEVTDDAYLIIEAYLYRSRLFVF